METLLKKYLWLIRFAGVAVVVAFAGSAVVTMIGARVVMGGDAAASLSDAELTEEEDAEDDEEDDDEGTLGEALAPVGVGADGRQRARIKGDIAADIVGRNLFCPTCKPEVPVELIGEDGQPLPDGPVLPGERKSALPLALLVTMMSDDPLASMATIQDTEKGRLGAFSVKDEVRPGVSIEEIHRGRVVLLNGRQREFIEIGQATPQAPAPKLEVTEAKPRARSKNPAAIDGAEDAISCNGDSCTVDRKFVDSLLSNPAQLARQARVIPDKNGKGFKFYGVRSGSLPKLLGVNNGDLVTEINGQALTSVDQAMAMYTKLRRASNLSVTIDRRGKTVTKEITIK